MPKAPLTRKKVPSEMQERWQHVVDTLAAVFEVPAALIMRVHTKDIEVFATSKTDGNPYPLGAKELLHGELYCENVIKYNTLLYVKDALVEEEWKSSPDIPLGMTSYLGIPVHWPDGEAFGTICVLDRKPVKNSALLESLLHTFCKIIEDELHLLVEMEERKRYEELLQGKMNELAEFNKELVRREKRILELKAKIDKLRPNA